MAKRLKAGSEYTTEFGSVKNGPAMYGIITESMFNMKNKVAKITMELHESEASYLAGSKPFATVYKVCTDPDFTTYFGDDPTILNTYWDNEMTHIDAQSYIRDDWENIP